MLYYAGIGSRETPAHIQNAMGHCARYLLSQGWTLRSGGASGADLAFEAAIWDANKEAGRNPQYGTEIFLPWRGYNSNVSRLCPPEYPFTKEELDLAASVHPAWSRCSEGARKLHARNVRIIRGLSSCDLVKFVVCWTNDGKPVGGTAQAIRLAEQCGIPVFNLGVANTKNEMISILENIKTKAKEHSN